MSPSALHQICQEITAEATASHGARLIAVSKTFPAEDVQQAYDAGQRAFGENRVQELNRKAPLLPKDIEWHLIGHLQANKVRHALEYADWIHSVDSESLLRRIDTIATEMGKNPKLLLEVNIGGEESKFGLSASEVIPLLKDFPCPRVCGLMTVAPATAMPDELRRIFGELRSLRDQAEKETGLKLPELSMGMSHDYHEALAEGATMVRVGSAVFGHRDYGEGQPPSLTSITLPFLGVNCYFISNPETRQALIVDPGSGEDEIIRTIEKLQLIPQAVLLTHAHVDHIGRVPEICGKYQIPVWLHQGDLSIYQSEENHLLPLAGAVEELPTPLKGEAPRCGFSFQVLHTPGHSPGSCCFYFPAGHFIITGDTLFQGTYGRTDFPGGNELQIHQSIREKLLTLPPDTIVYPGHGPSTTIAIEQRNTIL